MQLVLPFIRLEAIFAQPISSSSCASVEPAKLGRESRDVVLLYRVLRCRETHLLHQLCSIRTSFGCALKGRSSSERNAIVALHSGTPSSIMSLCTTPKKKRQGTDNQTMKSSVCCAGYPSGYSNGGGMAGVPLMSARPR